MTFVKNAVLKELHGPKLFLRVFRLVQLSSREWAESPLPTHSTALDCSKSDLISKAAVWDGGEHGSLGADSHASKMRRLKRNG